MAKHGRKMTAVHLSAEAREALSRIHEIWDAKDNAPSITNGAAVAISLRIWADILDPETDTSVYSDDKAHGTFAQKELHDCLREVLPKCLRRAS